MNLIKKIFAKPGLIGTSGKSYSSRNLTLASQCQVLKESDNIGLLINTYRQSDNEVVVDCADRCLRDLLLRTDGESYWHDLSAEPLSLKTRKTLAANAHAQTLRKRMLATLNDNQSLLEVIYHSKDSGITLAAIERLSDIHDLQVLVKRFKDKQKSHYRCAKNRLAFCRNKAKTLARLDEAASQLQQTITDESVTLSMLSHFEQQLTTVVDDLGQVQRSYYQQLTEQARACVDHTQNARQERQHILQTLKSTVQGFQSHTLSVSKSSFTNFINEQQAFWAGLSVWKSAEAKGMDIRFEQLLSQANQAASSFFAEQSHCKARQKLLEQGQRWLMSDIFVTSHMVDDLSSRWQALSVTLNSEQAAKQQQFADLQVRLKDKSSQQNQQQIENNKEIPHLVKRLKQLVSAGETEKANRLLEKIQSRLNEGVGVTKKVRQTFHDDLYTLTHRLHELKGWQHFGSNQVRHELLAEMQALANNINIDIELKAAQIQALQKRWKAIKGPANNALWQQFKHTSDEAWLPCAEYFKSKRQRSKYLLKERLAFLAETKTHLEHIDWQHPDWSALNVAHKKFEKLWRHMPALSEYDYVKAQKAYKAVDSLWHVHLEPERKRELKRRERLIKIAEEQADESDVYEAVATIKRLQSEWTPTVGLKSRQQEQALYQRFTKACDSVFDRQGSEKQQFKLKQQSLIDKYRSQLKEMGRLFERYADDGQLATLLSAFEMQRQALIDISSLPEKAKRSLENQLQRLQKHLAKYQSTVLLTQRNTYIKQLKQQDEICCDLEMKLLDKTEIDILQRAWQAIEPVLSDRQDAMKKRFEMALQYQQRDGDELAKNSDKYLHKPIDQAQEICLILELSADVPSPDDASAKRQAMHLEVLNKSMNGDKSFAEHRSPDGIYQLQLRWLTLPKAALTPEHSGADLSIWCQRFERGVSSLLSSYCTKGGSHAK